MTSSTADRVQEEPVNPQVVEVERVFLVGDRFRGFSQMDGVQTVSDFVSRIDAGEYDGSSQLLLQFGQGLEEFEPGSLKAAIDRRGLGDRIEIQEEHSPRVDGTIAHKHDSKNVLMSGFKQVHGDEFTGSLRITAGNELLLDHQTGLHVQGLVVVEVARQTFLSAFELGYRHKNPGTDYFLVWNSINMTFENFLFPLPGEVNCRVLRSDLSDPTKMDFDLRVEIHQGGRRAATALIGFTAFGSDRIESVEHHRATKAIAAVLTDQR